MGKYAQRRTILHAKVEMNFWYKILKNEIHKASLIQSPTTLEGSDHTLEWKDKSKWKKPI